MTEHNQQMNQLVLRVQILERGLEQVNQELLASRQYFYALMCEITTTVDHLPARYEMNYPQKDFDDE